MCAVQVKRPSCSSVARDSCGKNSPAYCRSVSLAAEYFGKRACEKSGQVVYRNCESIHKEIEGYAACGQLRPQLSKSTFNFFEHLPDRQSFYLFDELPVLSFSCCEHQSMMYSYDHDQRPSCVRRSREK